jgi:hypothetical protein
MNATLRFRRPWMRDSSSSSSSSSSRSPVVVSVKPFRPTERVVISNSLDLPQAGCYKRHQTGVTITVRNGEGPPWRASASTCFSGHRSERDSERDIDHEPVIWVVLFTEVRGEEEGCRMRQWPATAAGTDAQSTKPFHAETDARRAVSTVPPITTSFYEWH